jgi:5S rRNA maturation endonuclease (ribonuclease M5)
MTRDQIIAEHPIPDFVQSRGHKLKRAGKNFVTSGCPNTRHKPRHQCVTLNTLKNVWHCNDCDVGGTVIDWEMLERGCDAAEAMRILGGGRNGQRERTRLRPIRQTLGQREQRARMVKTYDYTDEKGELLFQACRYVPRDFRQRRPNGKGGWIDNITGVRRVLYRLPEVIEAQTVAVAEGEKDVDALVALEIPATCNPMGAKKWRDEYSEALRDKDVVIFGDDDEDGRAHVKQVIESLTRISRTIKRVSLPDGFHDVSDYIASLPKGTAAELIRKLIDETPEVSSLNSLNSLARNGDNQVDDFPEPLDEIAFHGLTGDIVRRIAPHTEADPAALLIQVLFAFANIIGRNAYMMADGARHYLNLFVLLVGLTSKSRKGTSWAHVLRIFQRVAELWAKTCIANGLSSGEGLGQCAIQSARKKRFARTDAGRVKKKLSSLTRAFRTNASASLKANLPTCSR